MINIKQIIQGLTCTFALVVAIASIGCKSPLILIENDSNGKATIHISIGQDGSRTIIPTLPSFTKYELSFSETSGLTHGDEIITTTNTDITLDPGIWTVAAKGYALLNGVPVVVAEGSSTFTVTAGQTISQAIHISASQTGEKGDFVFSILIPQGIPAQRYELSLTPYGSMEETLTRGSDVNTNNSAFTFTERIPVDPGYYLATARAEYPHRVAIKQEIVHIYSNMESIYNITYQPQDFMPVIELSGKLKITNNSVDISLDNYHVYAATFENGNYSQIGDQELVAQNGDWSLSIPSQDTSTDIYIRVTNWGNFNKVSPTSYSVSSNNISGIDFSFVFNTLTLSGAAQVTINEEEVQTLNNYTVYAHTDPQSYNGDSQIGYAHVDPDAKTWTMEIEKFPEATTIYLTLTDNNQMRQMLWTGEVFDADKPNIALTYNLNTIQLSGNLIIKLDGSPIDILEGVITAYTDKEEPFESRVGSTGVAENGDWTMAISAFNESTPVYFEVDGKTVDGTEFSLKPEQINVVADPISNLDFTFDLITISGSVSLIVDNIPQTTFECTLVAISDPDNIYESLLGQAEIAEGGSWSMVIPAFSEETTIHFMVQFESRMFSGKEAKVHNTPKSNINLIWNITSVPISGTVTGFTAASQIYAVLDPTDGTTANQTMLGIAEITLDGSWTILCDSALLQEVTDIYFLVATVDGEKYKFYRTISPVQVNSNGQSGITIEIADTVEWNPYG